MKFLWPIFAALSLYGETTLPSLIDSALQNERSLALDHRAAAAGLAREAAQRSYLPRIDGFASGTFVDRTGGFDAKQSYAAGAKAQFVVFDGLKREYLLDEKRSLEKAALLSAKGEKKSMTLEVIGRYFDLANISDELVSTRQMHEQLLEQLKRLEKFREAGLASDDALMRIRAEVANADYTLEDLRYQADRYTSALELLSGKKIDSIADSTIRHSLFAESRELDSIHSLRLQKEASQAQALQAASSNLPTLTLEDHYTYYDYRHDSAPFPRVDHQNKIIAAVSMNLVDFSAATKHKEALMAQAQAQNSDLAYAAKEAKENLALSKRSIDRSEALIESAKSAQEAALKTYEAIKRKYEARIVDYVTYLDALHTLTDSKNRLTRAKRSLDYAYAAYYYYAGYDPKEFVQ